MVTGLMLNFKSIHIHIIKICRNDNYRKECYKPSKSKNILMSDRSFEFQSIKAGFGLFKQTNKKEFIGIIGGLLRESKDKLTKWAL